MQYWYNTGLFSSFIQVQCLTAIARIGALGVHLLNIASAPCWLVAVCVGGAVTSDYMGKAVVGGVPSGNGA